MRIRTFVMGGTLGAAIAYYFDPVSGRGRRSRLRDQAMSQVRRMREQAERKARHASNVARGRLAEVVPSSSDDVDDGTLDARIRSTVFGAPDVPDERLTIEVVDGVVTLRGEVDNTKQALDIGERILMVPGVLEVLVLVHRPGEVAPNKADAIRVSHEVEKKTTRRNAQKVEPVAVDPAYVDVPEPPTQTTT